MEIEKNVKLKVKENFEVERDPQSGTGGPSPLDTIITLYVSTFSSSLVYFGAISTVSVTQALVTHLVATVGPNVERTLDNDAFFHLLLDLVMTGTKHEILT